MHATLTLPTRSSFLVGLSLLLPLIPAMAQPPDAPQTALQRLIATAVAQGDQFSEQQTMLNVALVQSFVEERFVAARDQAPRPDQQVGASSNATHATTLAMKPGISDYATLTAERDQLAGKSATDFTLTTTPFALYYISTPEDSPARWDQHPWRRSCSLSATFQDGDGTKPFKSAEVKCVPWGNRSSRDQGFRNSVLNRIEEQLGQAQDAYSGALKQWASKFTEDDNRRIGALEDYNRWRQHLGRLPTAAEIKTELDALVTQVRAKMSPAALQALKKVVSDMLQREGGLAQNFSKEFEDAIAQYTQGPEVSIAAGYGHDPTTSDYTYVDLSSSWTLSSEVSYSLSGSASVNDSLTSSAGAAMKRLRDYSASTDFSFGTPWKLLTLDASAAIDRDEASAVTIASASALATLTPIPGVSVPLSYTYANRTVDSTRHDSRFNVGLSVDAAGLLGAFKSKQ